MTAPPDLSIIIPTYNRLPLLKEALASFVGLLDCSYEVIIVDDGSTDGTTEYLRTLGRPCRVFFQEHKGGNAARNHGLREARGRYVKFLDDDDLLDPENAPRQLGALENRPEVDVCYSDSVNVYFGTDYSKLDRQITFIVGEMGNPINFLLTNYHLWPALFSFLYRRSALKSLRFDETLQTFQDVDFNISLAFHTDSFYYVPVCVGSRRVFEAAAHSHVSRTTDYARMMAYRVILDKIRLFMDLDSSTSSTFRRLLASNYYAVAENVFPYSRETFRECISVALAVYPGFVPDRPRYRKLVRIVGHELAQYVKYIYSHLRKERR